MTPIVAGNLTCLRLPGASLPDPHRARSARDSTPLGDFRPPDLADPLFTPPIRKFLATPLMEEARGGKY